MLQLCVSLVWRMVVILFRWPLRLYYFGALSWVARSEALRRAWFEHKHHALRKASERATRIGRGLITGWKPMLRHRLVIEQKLFRID